MRAESAIINILGVAVTAPSLVAAAPVPWTIGQSVQTTSGPVQGHAASGAVQVSEYLGIPYAQPPIGTLRFQPPAKFVGSSTINGSSFPTVNATLPDGFATLGVPASAVSVLTVLADAGPQSEDCLTLNIGDPKKAVLVWIHGGAFTTAPNLGLLDVRLAVQWIRDNIENFGGDANRITLFGQSAGGSLVDYYSYAYASDPIANGFISMSGTANGFGIFTNETVNAKWFNITSATP
ncbi:carboxylesterase [Colletotrichum tofieldiae]|nr:carboxylesterase [Colletotrichum tofieldiae]GKT85560.1 carboxylesterase [Colletotrichum tofieldiae]